MDVREKFAVEIKTYESQKSGWLAEGGNGAWVAIRGSHTVGPISVYGMLWQKAVNELGKPGQFFVKRVLREERPLVISRIR